MKRIFYAGTLLVLFALAVAFVAVPSCLGTGLTNPYRTSVAAPMAASADGSIVSLTHAIHGGDWAHAGDFFGGVILAKWHDEMAKLLFWIHLFS